MYLITLVEHTRTIKAGFITTYLRVEGGVGFLSSAEMLLVLLGTQPGLAALMAADFGLGFVSGVGLGVDTVVPAHNHYPAANRQTPGVLVVAVQHVVIQSWHKPH